MMQTLLVIFLGLVLIISLLWVLVPAFYGLPSVATSRERIQRALELAGPQPGETLYDLGSGHGRVLVMAAREFGLRAVGIEIGPVQCVISRLNSLLNGVGSRVRIIVGDLYRTDLSRADIVFAYLTSRYASRLQEKFERELKKGARIVTIAFDLPDWQPVDFDRENLVRLYEK